MKPARLKAIIRANVKALREKRGWNQEELAVAVDRTWQSISNIETGKTIPPLPTLAALATAFGVPMTTLLSEDGLPVTELRADLMQQATVTLSDLTDGQLDTAVKMLCVLHEGFRRG
ncbi:MAG: helix-turn-helix transcriptional regulator [Rhodospirillaceae bacterium]|nr:helix-turn-helix transcriptional regulator [Rhodospirillales bacterium]